MFTISGSQRSLESAHCKVDKTIVNKECVYQWVTLKCKFGPKKEQSKAPNREARFVIQSSFFITKQFQ